MCVFQYWSPPFSLFSVLFFFQFLVNKLFVFESCDLRKTLCPLFYLCYPPCSLIPALPALSVRYQKCRKCQTLLAAIISYYHHHSTPFPCLLTVKAPWQFLPESDFYHGLVVSSPFPSNFLSFLLLVDSMLAHKMLLLPGSMISMCWGFQHQNELFLWMTVHTQLWWES